MFKSLLLSLAACLLFVASPAHATQELACVMRFLVTDAATRQPVAASITLSDTRSGWVRSREVNDKGRASFRGIRPDAGNLRGQGHQLVVVSAPGYATQRFEQVACPHGRAVAGRVKLERQ